MHDSSGLLIGPTEPTPRKLTIVVSNDNGGGIFELLEQGDPRFSDVSSRIFGTPHDVDVGALCRAYHVESSQIEAADLAAALEEDFDGMRVLEVFPIVPLLGNQPLGVAAVSYAGGLGIGITADRDTFPDLDVFSAAVRDELRALAADGPRSRQAEPAMLS